MTDDQPIDVWLKFDEPNDEEPTYEANTFLTETGFQIQWYHVDIGIVAAVEFDTLSDVYDWYASHGYTDFTS